MPGPGLPDGESKVMSETVSLKRMDETIEMCPVLKRRKFKLDFCGGGEEGISSEEAC